MARQQTLKQAFAAVGQKTKAPMRIMRQSTLNFDGSAPALRGNDSDDDDCSDWSCGCDDHTASMNDEYLCICSREGCDYTADPASCNCNVCWEARIDNDLSLCAVRPGYFHNLQESAFADAVWEDDHWDHTVLQYYEQDCKPRHLKQFVQQRGLHDAYPAGVTLKYYYLKELVAADINRVFRFLNMPPELRNEVYGYLLAPRNGYSRWTQILRTCKTIHQEASEILYTDNVVSCTFWAQPPHQPRSVKIEGHLHREHHALELTQLPSAIDLYPGFLARVRNLKIELNLTIPTGATSFYTNASADFMRSGLLALASVVMDGGRLRTLQVNIYTSNVLEAEIAASILYPLRRLRNVETKFGGRYEMPDFLRDDMNAEMRLRDPVFNTLKHCRLVLSDAEAYMGMVNLLDPLPPERAQRHGASRAALIARQVRYLESKMLNGRSLFADWLGEVKVQTHLAKLQKQLAEVFPDKMKEMAESMSKTAGDRVEYQQTDNQRWTIGDLARAKSPSPDPAPL